MASVFLSYDRDDGDKARLIAAALENAGHSVWWDLHVRGGAQFSKVIEEALKAANAVVVLWSKHSIESTWVKDEAAVGRDTGRLIPVTIDGTGPPLGFRQFQTIDLSRWKGRGRAADLQALLEGVDSLAQSHSAFTTDLSQPRSAVRQLARQGGWDRRLVLPVGLVLVAALAALAWLLIERRPSTPTVAVASADSSPAGQALARDLLVKLGMLQRAQPDSIELVSENDTDKKPTLIFQVGSSAAGRVAQANLALTDATNRSLLWAKDFSDPTGNEADLRQQLAYTAAQVLRCAVEGTDRVGRLNRNDLKIYLNVCAPRPDASAGDIIASIADLRKLVGHAPHFGGGWEKLLLAETGVAMDPIAPEGAAVRRALAKDIAQAKKLHPGLAAAFVAEDVLTPQWQFLARGRLLDEGVEQNPASAELRSARHLFNANVGRVEDSLRDARRAMELDPLSPDFRCDYIISLAFAGRQNEALAELAQAERLWPGSTSLRVARYDLHNRTGDPREALRLLRAGVLGDALTDWIRPQESLLEARIDPTPAKVEKAIYDARAMYDRIPNAIALLSQALVEVHREDELFPILLNWRKREIVTWVTEVLFRPKFANFHKDPRFMQVAKRLGLLDYWRSSGKWPDLCSRSDLPYDCKKQAAGLSAAAT